MNFSARVGEGMKAHETFWCWLHIIGHQVFRANGGGEGGVDVLLGVAGGGSGGGGRLLSLTVLGWSWRVAGGVEPGQTGGGGVWLGTPQPSSLPH